MAGFDLSSLIYSQAAQDVNSFEPSPCPIGTFYEGDTNVVVSDNSSCQACPDGSTTQKNGSTSLTDCECLLCYMLVDMLCSK
jgi:hypothetical protein